MADRMEELEHDSGESFVRLRIKGRKIKKPMLKKKPRPPSKLRKLLGLNKDVEEDERPRFVGPGGSVWDYNEDDEE